MVAVVSVENELHDQVYIQHPGRHQSFNVYTTWPRSKRSRNDSSLKAAHVDNESQIQNV